MARRIPAKTPFDDAARAYVAAELGLDPNDLIIHDVWKEPLRALGRLVTLFKIQDRATGQHILAGLDGGDFTLDVKALRELDSTAKAQQASKLHPQLLERLGDAGHHRVVIWCRVDSSALPSVDLLPEDQSEGAGSTANDREATLQAIDNLRAQRSAQLAGAVDAAIAPCINSLRKCLKSELTLD
ncbi:MAG: hypothetical protein HUU22_17250 [Phycisphaerae bacterium]|nr:hypothetical protein [Phycisphaerae bacterium]NUQ47769.1 hypothetical protein [Phycisphaerae bacterium]